MVLLDRLRKAVKKLTFLLNLKNYLALTQSTLRLASLIPARAPASITARRWGRRAISFNDRPGLRACVVVDHDDGQHFDGENSEDEYVKSECSSSRVSPSAGTLRRSTSYPFEEDVDKQADMFIDNFYRHLIFEKQVSLNLRYCRDSSFGSSGDSIVSPLSSISSQLVSPT